MWNKSLTFQFLIMVVLEVFKVSLRDMVQDSVLWSRTCNSQFLVVVEVKVFVVFLPDMVVVIKVVSRNRFQRRFLELNMSMEVPFPMNVLIMDVFKALFQDRVQELVVELMSVVEVFRALSQDGVHQLLVELMFVAGFLAGSSSRLAPEVAVSSRPVRVTFSKSLSRGTTTFPQARHVVHGPGGS